VKAGKGADGNEGIAQTGAPEEIRTPDPQIRSLAHGRDFLAFSGGAILFKK
jgi:hypothetical protein